MPTDSINLMIRRKSQCLADIIRKYKYEFPLMRNYKRFFGDGIFGKLGECYYLDYSWKSYEKTIMISRKEFDNLTIGDYSSPTKDFPYYVSIGGYSTSKNPSDPVLITLHLV